MRDMKNEIVKLHMKSIREGRMIDTKELGEAISKQDKKVLKLANKHLGFDMALTGLMTTFAYLWLRK